MTYFANKGRRTLLKTEKHDRLQYDGGIYNIRVTKLTYRENDTIEETWNILICKQVFIGLKIIYDK